MKAIEKNLYSRGKSGVKYCRLAIPTAIREGYPRQQTHITVSLGTTDISVARKRLHLELVRIDAEFERVTEELRKRRAERTLTRMEKLTDTQLKSLGDYWIRHVLEFDQHRRENGLDDDEFEELDEKLAQQRSELGKMLATGRSEKILPAMQGFMHLCGIEVDMSPAEAKRAGQVFLSSVVSSLDHQLTRQGGSPVNTDEVVPLQISPKQAVLAEQTLVDWNTAFNTWRDYVPGRPKSTTIATRTPWNELRLCAEENGITCPEQITPELMRLFVDRMATHMAVVTLNVLISQTN